MSKTTQDERDQTNSSGAAVTRTDVTDYYKSLSRSKKLQTNSTACCAKLPANVAVALQNVHPAVTERYFGCGVTIPTCLRGKRVLDLGSGSGRDCYILAQLVGEEGEVVGVDMTEDQVQLACSYVQWHADKFGYKKPNTTFLQGYIEALQDLQLADNSFDIVVSNCVINLCPDKQAVFKEVFRVLKPGGELYFSDVYSDKRMPDALRQNKVLWGECVSGALYWRDFYSLVRGVGFADPRLVTDRTLTITNRTLQALVREFRFFSATFRLFKLPQLEHSQEDYGLVVRYKGTMQETPEIFTLDVDTRLEAGRQVAVSANTLHMLRLSRLAPHFDFVGNTQQNQHRGPFLVSGEGQEAACPFRSARSPDATSCESKKQQKVEDSCCSKKREQTALPAGLVHAGVALSSIGLLLAARRLLRDSPPRT